MKIRPNVKYLVKKHRDQIMAWRADGPLVASWEQICREICSLEKLAGTDQPTGDGLRKAWITWTKGAESSATSHNSQTTQNSEKVQTIQTNWPVRRVVKSSMANSDASLMVDNSQVSQNSETTQKMQISQTNSPETLANTGSPPVPSDDEYKSWPVANKIKWGKPETRPDGSRYFVPLSSFEIKQLEIWAQHDRCDAGEL